MVDLLFGGRDLIFDSPLTLEEATKRLQRDIAAPEWRIRENRPQSFVGRFADGRFQMMRLVRGRNSFRPMIDGEVSRAGTGCTAHVRLKLPTIGLFAVALFTTLGVTTLSSGIALVIAAASEPAFVLSDFAVVRLVFLVPAAPMLVGATVIPIIEARRAVRLLAALYEAEPSRRLVEGDAIGA